MKTLYKLTVSFFILISVSACKSDWLEREPEEILTDEQLWNNPELIISTIADYYSRLPQHTDFGGPYNCGSPSAYCGWKDYASYDEAMWSGVSNFDFEFRNNLIEYPFARWSLWNYDLVRDINLAIDKIGAVNSPKVPDAMKNQFIAELRFIRALNYFELVKRMGGVPIITEQLIYDFEGDPTYLQHPRNSEEEVYLFIESELDAITDLLGNEGSKTRANKYTAIALKSRAMLYAGS
ncbi:MAG TPA: RagB/SusD family nutrient uptake outer membrane protein, partial [Parapedobacter sp.]|nr:RagB/SusD family nutrient uptake outer membrane protein [Parapedobacter sp.]